LLQEIALNSTPNPRGKHIIILYFYLKASVRSKKGLAITIKDKGVCDFVLRCHKK